LCINDRTQTSYQLAQKKQKEVELQENGTQKESGKERLKRKGRQDGEP
jgi:hypothetical protein